MATTSTTIRPVYFLLSGERQAAFDLIPQAEAIGEIYASVRSAHDKLSFKFQEAVKTDGYAFAISNYGDLLATADHRLYTCELAIQKAVELVKSHYPSGVVGRLVGWFGDRLHEVASQSGGDADDRGRNVRAICELKECFQCLEADNRYVGRNAKWF